MKAPTISRGFWSIIHSDFPVTDPKPRFVARNTNRPEPPNISNPASLIGRSEPSPAGRREERKSGLLAVLGLCLLLAKSLSAAEGITNVRVSQRAGTNLVDLHYDLATVSTNGILVTVAVSTNGSNTYDLAATRFTGDVGTEVMAGTNKWIVWDAGRDWPDRFSTNVFFRIAASDVPPGMVLIPAGSFTMGDTTGDGFSNEGPTHTVYVSAFYMDKYEVTKTLWDEVYSWAIVHGYSFDHAGSEKAANHPVEMVDWYDVVKWCNARSEKEGLTAAYYMDEGLTQVYKSGQAAPCANWMARGYRLPTDAEWEYAARGGLSGQRFWWGSTITHSQANYYSTNAYSFDVSPTRGYHPNYANGPWPYTSPVGSFAANGYGLYDMTGNVYEWCWDWGGDYSSVPQTNPRGPSSGSTRVFRGGAWSGDADYCRVSSHFYVTPDYEVNNLGFRSVLPSGQ
jgi:formylglycine-generating enzyme